MDEHEKRAGEGDDEAKDVFVPVKDADLKDPIDGAPDARKTAVPDKATNNSSVDTTVLPPYKPYLDYEQIKGRLTELEEELELVRCSSAEYVVSNVPESVQLGGTNRFYREDLLQTLYRECQRVRMELRLHGCDRELYLAYGSETDFFETTALHGYSQLQRREGVRTKSCYLPHASFFNV